jgi:hypothetical protein
MTAEELKTLVEEFEVAVRNEALAPDRTAAEDDEYLIKVRARVYAAIGASSAGGDVMQYEVSDVATALAELMDAQAAERAGREGYEGGSWGWHGAYLIEAVRKAEERLAERLNAVIDARVEAKLAERLPPNPVGV